VKSVKLTAALVERFSGLYLSHRYDQPVATPPFHRLGWELYCSDAPQASLVAPREHAKSTSLTYDYIMAEMCFRSSDYGILIGATEEMAAEQLSNIREELLENDDLRMDFEISHLEKDSSTDIIVVCKDGHRFRVLARGAEQRIRGRMWKGKRPNLIVCDDMEDDEQVENKDRRDKFRRWFFRAAKQSLGRGGKIRAHGTILHEDSLLARLQKNPEWKSLFFKAHFAFDDFSEILWPEAWPEARLRARQREFVADGDAAGYAQEFLNDPQDNAEAYLRKQDFLEMALDDFDRSKVYGAAADFAVSKADLANRTSFTVGGKDTQNILHIVDQRVGRWAASEVLADGTKAGWIEEMFSIQTRWDPEFFWVEDGVIWKAIKDIVYSEMRLRDIWINIVEVPSIKDKATRGRTYQKRHRAGGMRFDKRGEWYPGYEAENLKFTGNSQATLDDQFDSTALLCLGFDRHMETVEEEQFMELDELEILHANRRRFSQPSRLGGVNQTTGY
jgi:hypothetical protein